jgi:hypothetical protein
MKKGKFPSGFKNYFFTYLRQTPISLKIKRFKERYFKDKSFRLKLGLVGGSLCNIY